MLEDVRDGTQVMVQPDFFSSKGGVVKLPEKNSGYRNYNEITVEFPDESSQTMFHLSGNASHIFPGQVLRAGEYIGRMGGMSIGGDPLPEHLHHEVTNMYGVLLDTASMRKMYMPEKDLEGNKWECRGYCDNPALLPKK